MEKSVLHASAFPLILRPSAGLANRMRAVDSCVTLCGRVGRPLEIIWFRDASFGARFCDLFEPLELSDVVLREASPWEIPLYDVPLRRRNLKLPILYQWLRFGRSRRVSLWQCNDLARAHRVPDIFQKTNCTVYLACGSQLVPTELRYAMFRPLPALQTVIDDTVSTLPRRTVGVHIRRGDHLQAIRESPTELFEVEIRRLLDAGECDAIYLATDSGDVRRHFRDLFGNRIHSRDTDPSRDTVAGIHDAVVDLWTLSHCNRLIGSSGSTFAETAAWMSQRPYSVLRQ